MKIFIQLLFPALIIFSLAGCKKDNSQLTIRTALIGNWELRQLQAGMTPTIEYPSGKGPVYRFTATTYSISENGIVTKNGNYRIVEDKTVSSEVGLVLTPGQYTNRIVFDNDTVSNKIFFQVSTKTLSFLSGFFPLDGGTSKSFERI